MRNKKKAEHSHVRENTFSHLYTDKSGVFEKNWKFGNVCAILTQ